MFDRLFVYLPKNNQHIIFMKTTILTLIALLPACLPMKGQDHHYAQLEQRLRQAPIQEKIYLHTDNTCYFKGDTIWYKAYVVRADNLTYTDMSRITYIELLSPDGMLVERQQIVTSANGFSCGSFALQDSIYSGYYELRAYTRWMLNFGVTRHDYNYADRLQFFTRNMADDFYREYGTTYSRVLPVYERPEEEGDYSAKYIVERPKMRLEKDPKPRLTVNFYPEGGHLVAGTRCQVAFEAFDEDGRQVDIEGRVGDMTVKTMHEGRGVFSVVADADERLQADFTFEGKDYHFKLPKAERSGYALTLNDRDDHIEALITPHNTPDTDCATAVFCRGVLCDFQTVLLSNGHSATVNIDKKLLSTGVCNLVVVNHDFQPVADRLFFVNHHDYDQQTITVSGLKDEYAPLEQAAVTLQAPPTARHLSIAIRDAATDEATYDTGNVLTDLLLSSEVQGFVPHPDYYFEADDTQHRQHLDLLLMVQGWRRYAYEELASAKTLRYTPEATTTIDGNVYAFTGHEDFEDEQLQRGEWIKNQVNPDNPRVDNDFGFDEAMPVYEGTADGEQPDADFAPTDDTGDNSSRSLYNSRRLKHEVTVKGELILDGEVADIEMSTSQGGHFAFDVPAYYGDAILFLMAYDSDEKEKKVQKYMDKDWRNEQAIPNYYVKRNLFFPIFCKKYSYYQCHTPEDDVLPAADMAGTTDVEQLSSMDRTLQNVNVSARRRRGRRRVDYSKPAMVLDTYELYNLAVDYGMMPAYYTFTAMPQAIARLLLGTHGSYQQFVIETGLDDTRRGGAHGDLWYEQTAMLCRQDKVYVYTDLEPRNPDKPHEHPSHDNLSRPWEVLMQFNVIENNSKRPTYRDRRIILHGFHEPQEFYHRDYSCQPLSEAQKDYRRTLYWNPNAILDAEGRFTATFYNNNKLTRMRVSSVGLTGDGRPVSVQ